MAKVVELRRHHDAEADFLTEKGVGTALELGAGLSGDYDVFISSGAQRSTQTLACYLAASALRVAGGVVVDARFRSALEDRWKAAYEKAGAGDIESFQKADPQLVEKETALLAAALRELFESLPDGGRALVVGHSPMQEAAVYGLTGRAVGPLSKGAGVAVVLDDDGGYGVEQLD
ncbi:MAG TPA: hypothetical protein VJ927_03270 [Actinomycetota bacterium]|nr:hypothetical protein [Actinomycetota bacterium]